MWGDEAAGEFSEEVLGEDYVFIMRWRAPRNRGWWYIYSPNAHRLRGLGAVKVLATMTEGKSCDSAAEVDKVCTSPGGAALEGATTLSDMCWVFGSSGVPPPGMACQTSTTYMQCQVKCPTATSFLTEELQILGRFSTSNDQRVYNTVGMLVPTSEGVGVIGGRGFAGTRDLPTKYSRAPPALLRP
jgi:hypothetical protein